MIRRLAIYYFGGAVGAVVNSLLVWLVAAAGVLQMMGVAIAPRLTWTWLAPRILWGGIWGLGFVAVAHRFPPVRAGLALSLGPSLAQLFYFYPTHGHGWLGVEQGALTPVVVLIANAVWGWTLGRVVASSSGNG